MQASMKLASFGWRKVGVAATIPLQDGWLAGVAPEEAGQICITTPRKITLKAERDAILMGGFPRKKKLGKSDR